MRGIYFRAWVLTRCEKFRLIVFGFLTLFVSSRVFAVPQVVQDKRAIPAGSQRDAKRGWQSDAIKCAH